MQKDQLLIVDDDVAICQIMQMLLNDLCETIFFHDTKTAQEYLEKNSNRVKLLIVDFCIGKDSGIDFFKNEILAKNRNIPGILISGFIVTKLKTKDELKNLDKMFIKIFEKPFDFVDLRNFLETELFPK